MNSDTLIVRHLGLQDYLTTWHAMQQFTNDRDEHTADELWLLEHPAVFTQGQNGKPEHVLSPGAIPVIQTDRGGQVTYHGPGQLIAYILVDLKRKKFNIRQMVSLLENAIVQLLAEYGIEGFTKCDAPGVYVDNKKICSIGLRIRRGCSFHGLALNVAMDLQPFRLIHPCGFPHLEMTQIMAFNQAIDMATVNVQLISHLTSNLGYNEV